MVRESRIDLVSGELRKQLDIAKVAVDRLGVLSAEIYQFLPFFSLLDISENDCRDLALLRLYKNFRQRIINFWRCLLHPSPWRRRTTRICTNPHILVQPYLLERRLKKGLKKVFWMEK